MTFSTDTINEQQYDAWQNQLLAEMGITRWVRQSCPVKTFETLENLDVLFDNTAIDSAPNQPLMLAHQSADLASHTATSDQTAAISHPVMTDNTVDITAQPSPAKLLISELDGILDNATGLSNITELSDATEPSNVTDQSYVGAQSDNILTASFELQAVVVGEWTLVVDSRHLQTDERERQLWHQITHNLRAQLHFFKFPLLADNHQLPKATAQLMRSDMMAMAGVSGFLFSVSQANSKVQGNPKAQGNPKVGALTPLPDCLDEQPIQRLPYLGDMLEDYRLKRQLWQLLSR